MLMTPSVVVRTFNSARTVGAALDALDAQTIRPEILVIDSGSSDGTLDLVRGRCDQLLQLPLGSYRPGLALNRGAEAASGEICFAFSSHCHSTSVDWIERSLAYYARPEVAATNGTLVGIDGAPLDGLHLQSAEEARRVPYWGFSNHAASWRRDVWREHPFSESLAAVEDKEWGLRIMAAGWRIAYHPELWVGMSHRWERGARNFYTRERYDHAAMGSFVELPRYRLDDMVREWSRPPYRGRPLGVLLLSPRRAAGLVGKYLGHRDARRAR